VFGYRSARFRSPFLPWNQTQTMLSKKPQSLKQQAISGVSPGFESIVEEMYPSIAATGIGQVLNNVYEAVPTRIWGIKLTNAFALPTAPLGMVVYLLMKVFGERYVVTNRAVKRVAALGFRLFQEVPLAQIAGVSIDPDSRLAFFKTGDVRLTNAAGETLLLMRGIPYPERFQQVINETRTAKSQTAAALATINARH
jgi:hypothetical protein